MRPSYMQRMFSGARAARDHNTPTRADSATALVARRVFEVR
jgi:hypothetical protein